MLLSFNLYSFSLADAIKNQVQTTGAGSLLWTEVDLSSLLILLSQICFPKSTLSNMLGFTFREEGQLGKLSAEHSLLDDANSPSIQEKIIPFLSEVSI
jgi:hypothetical protein